MDPLARLLNPPQLAAVRHGTGPLLILAGAGSGKTRVLTHRIAHLLHENLARPGEIMAVTFTNKAAGELKERVAHLVGPVAERLWVSTFHAFGARVLRRECEALSLTRSFAIYDDGDQLSACKRACEASSVEISQAKNILHRIDRWKNEGLLPAEVLPPEFDVPAKVAARVYARYQQELQQSQAVDFGDLIVRVVELFKKHVNIADTYAARFRFILVDEFQDTNPAQYELLKRLEQGHQNLCVVGDDDQSIYRWRGAEVSNILDFPKDHPGCTVVKLEQNYRSTGNILGAAHAVIAKNSRRAEKKLWTASSAGEKIKVVVCEDERDEGFRIAHDLYAENARGTSYSQMAILYRQNAQSRALEDQLRARKVPYRVVRGRSFYDRAEVKDVASYLRLCVNPRSDGDLLRIVNQPPRGIGDTTVERLRQSALRRGFSLWEALTGLEDDAELPSNAKAKLIPLRTLLVRLQQEAAADGSATGAIERVLDQTGLEERYLDEGEEGAERVENLRELLGAARDFDAAWREARESGPDAGGDADSSGLEDTAEEEITFASDLHEGPAAPDAASGSAAPGALGSAATEEPVGERPDLRAELAAAAPDLDGDEGRTADTPLLGFLEQLALVGDADAATDGERASLMTYHAAKGLEFDAVWMTGLEERVFPGARSLGLSGQGATGEEDPDELAEERRLCYVGMTRARKRLTMTLAKCRSLFGELRFNEPSRFLAELPKELAEGLVALEGLNAGGGSGRGFGGGYGGYGGGGGRGGAGGDRPWARGGGGRGSSDDFDQRPQYGDDGPPASAWSRKPSAPAPKLRPQAAPPGGGATVQRPVPGSGGPGGGTVDGFSRGARVRHPAFGIGSIEELDGAGQGLKLVIRFAPGVGLKKVLARFVERV